MSERDIGPWKGLHYQRLSRRGLMRGAGFALGAGLLSPRLVNARGDDDGGEARRADNALAKAIPGGVAPVAPFGVRVHHNPLNPTVLIGNINDPSQIFDFDGFVGLTHIRGGGTGTNTVANTTSALAFQADMGFSKGKFIGVDGHKHEGTLAFV